MTRQVTVSGSGAAGLTGLELSGVVVDLSGSGNVELAGRAGAQQVTVSGSGNYQAADLTTQQTDIAVSGSGDAAVNASRRLPRVTGSGTITYTGNPARSTGVRR